MQPMDHQHQQQSSHQPVTRKRSMVDALISPSNKLDKFSNNKRSNTGIANNKPFKTEGLTTIVEESDSNFLEPTTIASGLPPLQKTPDKLLPSPFAESPLISRAQQRSVRKVNPVHLTAEDQEALLHQMRGKSCIFNDPVHGNIPMDGLCLKIIDTKEFQRLRYLKQLGTCDYVYPGATHSRFSHSIGVAYLSEVVLKNLKANQTYLNITPIDILCVKVAGLCHDLGHGAYSHVWEVFMKKVAVKEWHHENSSVEMFQYLIQKNQISLSSYGLTPQDELFITEIIRGVKEKHRQGRPKEKFFLYDIVNNSRSGLDVDKLDYFSRDIKHSNVNINSVSFDRFFQLGRVLKAEPIQGSRYQTSSMQLYPPDTPEVWTGKSNEDEGTQDYMYTICYPMKMVGEALNLFAMRYHLHQKVYTHKSVKKVECMLVDAFAKADPFLRIPGTVTGEHPDGLYKLSECVFDACALSNLNDNIIYLVEISTDPNLIPAKEVILKLRERRFYDCLGKSTYLRRSIFDRMTINEITDEIVATANKHIKKLKDKELKESQKSGSQDISHNYSSLDSSFDELVEGTVLPADEYVFSQDSFPPWLSREPTADPTNNGYNERPKIPFDTVEPDDIIVEKMHIHYGLKEENPVSRLRFFTKEASEVLSSRWDDNLVAIQIKESQYNTLLPRVFEELAVRVFCRSKEKSPFIAEAFRSYCREKNESAPFLTLSQPI